ncbi:UNVERIFIED_CONTAM: hypothetical protein Scaly_2436600 [Sesamum calycinum]|uniref:Uncharacterized protein n=1 Tax=Sesamum calycinum TaxID=2727403 RepID=A0AAW2LZW3_9LAMI
MQLLIGLDDPYDHIRSQVLAIEPLPSVNKAFVMVERVEKQRKLNSMSTEPTEGVALNVQWFGPRGRDQKPEAVKWRDMVDKRSQFCTHCDKSRHTREMCFKLHGYPKWYKTLQEQRKNEGRNSAHLVQNQLQLIPDTSADTKSMLGITRRHLLKLFRKNCINS